MKGEDPSDGYEGNWGELLKHAATHGVTLDRLDAVTYADDKVKAVTFLRREFEGQMLTYAMPENCPDERPLGFGRMANICQRLRIPEPKGWPIDF